MLIGDFYYELPKTFPELNATSFYFVAFCFLVFIFYSSTKNKIRPYVLLIANIVFILSFGVGNLLWVLAISLIGYLFAHLINSKRNKKYLYVGVILIAAILIAFKYLGHSKGVIIPLGLSFYSFKTISYLVDVYEIEIDHEENVVMYLDYVLFFPCIIAGPINKAKSFLEELKSEKEFDYTNIATGFFMLACGLFEKLVFSDFLATMVTRTLDSSEALGLNVLLGIFIYSFEIYLDFDAYSNIAIGASRMLGFNIPANFHTPYLSKNIKEFWGRWHISLSTWLKDYIYIPLGGSYTSDTRKYINIIIVFLVSGLWHGLTINFIIWGLIHGIVRVLEELLENKFVRHDLKKPQKIVVDVLMICLNFIIVTSLWMVFKYTNLTDLGNVVSRLFDSSSLSLIDLGITRNEIIWISFIIILTVILDVIRNKFRVAEYFGTHIFIYRWLIYVVLILVFLVFGIFGGSYTASDFIYRWF